jgi:hypothetical protein
MTNRSAGRGWFLAGLAACLLGIGLYALQLRLRHLFVPWYMPAAATLGVGMLLLSVARRRSVVRVVALLLVAAIAGLQWVFLVSLDRLPAYGGPARPGQPFPAFQTTFADGRRFTEADLRDRSRRAMVFFRGRW